VLLAIALVLAAPRPTGTATQPAPQQTQAKVKQPPRPNRVRLQVSNPKPGDIVLVRAHHLLPPEKTGFFHPNAIVSDPNEDGIVKLAPLTHNPTTTDYKPSIDYGLDRDSILQGHILVGQPKEAYVHHLEPATREPKQMTSDNIAKLMNDINKKCPGLNLPGGDGSSCNAKSQKGPTPTTSSVQPPAEGGSKAHDTNLQSTSKNQEVGSSGQPETKQSDSEWTVVTRKGKGRQGRK
jgi:hypothetical protein